MASFSPVILKPASFPCKNAFVQFPTIRCFAKIGSKYSATSPAAKTPGAAVSRNSFVFTPSPISTPEPARDETLRRMPVARNKASCSISRRCDVVIRSACSPSRTSPISESDTNSKPWSIQTRFISSPPSGPIMREKKCSPRKRTRAEILYAAHIDRNSSAIKDPPTTSGRSKRFVKPIRVIKRLETIAVFRELVERRGRNFSARGNQKLLVCNHCIIVKPDLALLGIHERNLRTRMKINPVTFVIVFFSQKKFPPLDLPFHIMRQENARIQTIGLCRKNPYRSIGIPGAYGFGGSNAGNSTADNAIVILVPHTR